MRWPCRSIALGLLVVVAVGLGCGAPGTSPSGSGGGSGIAEYDPALQMNPMGPSQYETQLKEEQGRIDRWTSEITQLDEARAKRKYWLDYIAAINDARPTGKGLWISSIQTAIIGGTTNTEDNPNPTPSTGGGSR